MSIVKQTLWIVERHLDRDARLADLAASCGVTPTHLSHAFSQTVGQSLTGYVRGRRLAMAAEQLASGADDILRVALEAGYGSHEAFTRAFRKEFGKTPERVRQAGTTSGLTLLAAAEMTDDLQPGIALMGRRQAQALRLVGLRGRFGSDTMREIPMLWRRFGALYSTIENPKEPVPLGLSGPFDDHGMFDYACALEVAAGTEAPAGMIAMNVPAADYAIFRHQGHVSTIGGTYRRILDFVFPENGWTIPNQPILERHDKGFDVNTGGGGISIWVPVSNATGPVDD